MKEFLLRAATLAAALICGTIVGWGVSPIGLALPYVVLWPLIFVIAALSAALVASLVGILLAPDRTSSRLLAVVGTAQAAAVFAAIFVLTVAIPAVMQAGGWLQAYHRVYLLGAAMIVIGLTASWAMWRSGSSGREVSRRGLLGHALMVVGLVVLAVVVEAAMLYAFFAIQAGI